MKKPTKYTSIWDAIADTPAEAANLRARADLMRQIAAIVKKSVGPKWKRPSVAALRSHA